jgi:hypothetical protein
LAVTAGCVLVAGMKCSRAHLVAIILVIAHLVVGVDGLPTCR